MTISSDQVMRGYSALISLKQNLPDHDQLEKRWVDEFHQIITRLEKTMNTSLEEFKVPDDALERSVATPNNIMSGQVTYRPGLWCERSVLLHKLDGLLTYFSMMMSPEEKKIGFTSNVR